MNNLIFGAAETASANHKPAPEILELVNQARLKLKKPLLMKLPQGIPGNSRQCVLGRSLGVEVLLDEHDGPFALVQQYRRACVLASIWNVDRPCAVWDGWAFNLPAELSKFILEFDTYRYPQLVSDQNLSSSPSSYRAMRMPVKMRKSGPNRVRSGPLNADHRRIASS